MWIKDKLVRNIIISVIVIALLAGAYIWIVNIPDEPQETVTQTSEGVSVYTVDSASVEKLYIKNETSEYTIVKTDSGYTIMGYEDIDFAPETIVQNIYMLSDFSAEKEIENPDIVQYGLDNPTAVMEISADGVANTIEVGNKMVGGNGYFIRHKQSGKVYLLPEALVISFMMEVNDYRPTTLATADITNINKLDIATNGQTTVSMRKLNDEEKDEFSMFTSYVMTYPHYASVQRGALEELAEGMGVISVKEYVEDKPGDLAKYGLANPKFVLELESASGSYKVLYGNKTETDGVYAMLSDKNFVFETDSTIYDSLEGVQVLRLLERYAHIIDMYEVAEISVSGNGENYKFVLTGDEQNKKVTVNGAPADIEKFKLAYQSIIGIDVSGFTENASDGEECARIEFKLYDGNTVTARYLTYDERNYVLERNGVKQSTVLKENVDTMFKTLNEYAKNPN